MEWSGVEWSGDRSRADLRLIIRYNAPNMLRADVFHLTRYSLLLFPVMLSTWY